MRDLATKADVKADLLIRASLPPHGTSSSKKFESARKIAVQLNQFVGKDHPR